MPNKDESPSLIDIREDDLMALSSEVLDTLLRDHTTGRNIFWATHDYEALGSEYDYHSQILPALITGKHGMVIRPRVLKTKEEQTDRAKDMAEVFTPSWVCNAQNNLVDEAWFGRKDVFNTEDNANHTWQDNTLKIEFPEGKTWKDYVRATRMEMTCGEAPYLVSRYDTTTGNPIPLQHRIGLLDRKLRVVSENVDESGEWLEWAQMAYKNTYGFEWQGDNLLLAREAMLWTFIEYYQAKFGKAPLLKSINYIAYIISWNIWQMDGLKGVVPNSCKEGIVVKEMDLFGETECIEHCKGCQQDNIRLHNGVYCLLRDWGHKDPKTGENNRKIRFIDLIK
ncbi:MAG: restriction endonuclease subunit M [Bacteroidaceae bacterium]|nr:restriction endonuclease subunit M [Bacteroidaceae bacterium]